MIKIEKQKYHRIPESEEENTLSKRQEKKNKKNFEGNDYNILSDDVDSVHESTTEVFKPDFHVTKILQKDLDLLKKMSKLYYYTALESVLKSKPKYLIERVTTNTNPLSYLHHDSNVCCCPLKEAFSKKLPIVLQVPKPNLTPESAVLRVSTQLYGARELTLLTDDHYNISALFFKRKNAKVNIIYVIGWLYDHTPTKEWCAPFADIFPEHNLMCFDWRGSGKSEGKRRLLEKWSFGTNSWLDIKACIDFIKMENDLPVVLHGFCAGGLLGMDALLKTLNYNKICPPEYEKIKGPKKKKLVDAIGLSCTFGKFDYMHKRAHIIEKRLIIKLGLKLRLAKMYMSLMFNGSLFKLNGKTLLDGIKEKLDCPIWFDHTTPDKFSELSQGIMMYEHCKCKKYFFQSEFGKHIRSHTEIPHQYGEAYNNFLKKFEIIN